MEVKVKLKDGEKFNLRDVNNFHIDSNILIIENSSKVIMMLNMGEVKYIANKDEMKMWDWKDKE